jgi:hypothetical protein
MLIGDIYERMGIGHAPKQIAQKPLLSVMLEKIGHLPEEDEVFFYEGMRITPKTMASGRPLEVLVQIMDDEDIAESREEVRA